MPSFKKALTDTQLWQVSQLVAHADAISDSVKKELMPEARTGNTAARTCAGKGSVLLQAKIICAARKKQSLRFLPGRIHGG